MSALAQGAQLVAPHPRRGRPKLHDSPFSGEDDPRLQRSMEDFDVLRDYETALEAFRGESVKQRKDESFDQWGNRLMPLARKAWNEFAWNVGTPAPPSDGPERRMTSEEIIEGDLNAPVVIQTIPLSDDRLRVLVTRAIRRVDRRRDSTRARLARCLVAQRWGVPLDNLDALRGRIDRARKWERKRE